MMRTTLASTRWRRSSSTARGSPDGPSGPPPKPPAPPPRTASPPKRNDDSASASVPSLPGAPLDGPRAAVVVADEDAAPPLEDDDEEEDAAAWTSRSATRGILTRLSLEAKSRLTRKASSSAMPLPRLCLRRTRCLGVQSETRWRLRSHGAVALTSTRSRISVHGSGGCASGSRPSNRARTHIWSVDTTSSCLARGGPNAARTSAVPHAVCHASLRPVLTRR
mmetsp:Transcript_2362/g.9051  ORF Transcript_2362/g.9051 Transcript_2362/m.9051 type:complete len:222 (+) Transcript_2362:596-1261(+)